MRTGDGAGTAGAAKDMLRITDGTIIQDWELSEQFTRASGPGGQNVNKVSSAVELRFEAARSPNLAPPVKSRLKRLAGRRWTSDGALILRVEDTRSQTRNREIARERLAELIRAALKPPRPRIRTRPPRSADRKRLEQKTQRSTTKALRGRVSPDAQN